MPDDLCPDPGVVICYPSTSTPAQEHPDVTGVTPTQLKALAEQHANLLLLVRQIAMMTVDGEKIEGETFTMQPEDAVDTLNTLICHARSIIGMDGI